MTLGDLIISAGDTLGTFFGLTKAGTLTGEAVGRVGAAGGAMEGSIEEEGQAAKQQGSKVPRPSAGLPDAGTAILDALRNPAPVPPGAAINQTVQGITGGGGPLGYLREYGVWILIALVGLVGLWGLIAPGGGVALIERARR